MKQHLKQEPPAPIIHDSRRRTSIAHSLTALSTQPSPSLEALSVDESSARRSPAMEDEPSTTHPSAIQQKRTVEHCGGAWWQLTATTDGKSVAMGGMNVLAMAVQVCDALDLPLATRWTALHFMHRYMAFCSMAPVSDPNMQKDRDAARAVDFSLVLCGCVYMACKSCESLRKLRDIIHCTYCCLHPDEPFMQIQESYWKIRDSVGKLDFFLMRVFNFQLAYQSPLPWLVHIVKTLFSPPHKSAPMDVFFSARDVSLSGQVVGQVALAMLNDVFESRSDLSVRWTGRELAVAAIFHAMQQLGLQLQDPVEHWSEFWAGCRYIHLQTIVTALSQLYQDLHST